MGKTVRRNSRKMNGGNAKRSNAKRIAKRIAKRSNAKRNAKSNVKRSNLKRNRYVGGGVIDESTKSILKFIMERFEGNKYDRNNYHQLFLRAHSNCVIAEGKNRAEYVIARAKKYATEFQIKLAERPMYRYPRTTKLIYEYLKEYTSQYRADYILLLEGYDMSCLNKNPNENMKNQIMGHSQHQEWVQLCSNMNNQLYLSQLDDRMSEDDVGAALHFIRTVALPYIQRELRYTMGINTDNIYEIRTIQILKEKIELFKNL